MTKIFVFTAAKREAQEHLANSIRSPIDPGKLYEGASADLRTKLDEVRDQAGAFWAWGAEPGGGESFWRKMKRDDFVFCVFSKTYHYVSRVVSSLHSKDLAEKIWGRSEETGQTWEYMYFLTEPEKVSIPLGNLEDYLSSLYLGFTRIGDEGLEKIRQEFGSVENFVESKMMGGGSTPIRDVDDFLPVMRRYEQERIVFRSLARGNHYRVAGVRDKSVIIRRLDGNDTMEEVTLDSYTQLRSQVSASGELSIPQPENRIQWATRVQGRSLGMSADHSMIVDISSKELALRTLIKIVTSLRVDQSRGSETLYKPAVISAVLAGIEEGELTENKIGFDWVAPKALRKLTEAGVEAGEQQVAYAFYHLSSDRFWLLAFNPPHWDLDGIPSPSLIRQHISHATLKDAYWELLQDPESRGQVITALQSRWFGELEDSQVSSTKVWIEKCNVHRNNRLDRTEGPHKLGQALWSPHQDKRGAHIYEEMKEVRAGDIILHLTDRKGITHKSIVHSEADDTFTGIEGTPWEGAPSYRIQLSDCESLEPILDRNLIFKEDNHPALKRIFDQRTNKLFYNLNYQLNEGGYLTHAPEALIALLNKEYKALTGRLLIETSAEHQQYESSEEFDLDWLERKTLWPREDLEELIGALKGDSPQIVLSGPPGTSKTWVAKHLATHLTRGQPEACRMVQFHPSYGYEEFVEGLRPVAIEGGIDFRVEPGVIRNISQVMSEKTLTLAVLVIDEMNRANLPRVFGELMYLFEYRDQDIDLQFTQDFSLPGGLKFIGTMNTADRSIRSIDIALRRRFDVFECNPDIGILKRFYEKPENKNEVGDQLFEGIEKLNEKLLNELDRHHTIGHTFFMSSRMTQEKLRAVWDRKLSPLIEEYFFDQPDKTEDYQISEFWPSVDAD